MKYLIIGSGGTGGAIGGFLALAGNDVTLIARGSHLDAIKRSGLKLKSGIKGDVVIKNIKVCTMEEYSETPQVAFVCVKGYSLDDARKLLERCADENTIIIPVLNIYGTGEMLRNALPGKHVLDGCIYITSYISAPGEISHGGKLFKVVFGENDGSRSEVLDKIAAELTESGIRAEIPDDIKSACYEKFTLISMMATAGAYFDTDCGHLNADSEKREFCRSLLNESTAIAKALGLKLSDNIIEKNMHYLETAAPETTASMQKDLKKGGKSEVDGIVFEPVRLGRRCGVETPAFLKAAVALGFEA